MIPWKFRSSEVWCDYLALFHQGPVSLQNLSGQGEPWGLDPEIPPAICGMLCSMLHVSLCHSRDRIVWWTWIMASMQTVQGWTSLKLFGFSKSGDRVNLVLSEGTVLSPQEVWSRWRWHVGASLASDVEPVWRHKKHQVVGLAGETINTQNVFFGSPMLSLYVLVGFRYIHKKVYILVICHVTFWVLNIH